MERLEVIDLEKSFGRTRALAGVSFSVKQGELLALLGPSGCGKTTCLRLIAGFERPDKGDIRIDGTSILGLPPERRGIGFVFQHYALFPHMTVAKNIAYGIRFRSGIDVRARVGELLSLVHLEGRADRRPAELSGGERQRVALARALAPSPRLLLLDEPLSALDAALQEELRRELRRIQRAFSLPTVYVTHDQAEALAIADRIGVMNAGRIEQIGRPDEVYRHPRTRFTAAFLGRGSRFLGRISSGESVIVNGHPLRIAPPREEIPTGTEVEVIVREEDVRLGPGENPLPVEVVESEYHGDARVIIASTPIGIVRARIPEWEESVQPGARLTFHLPPDRIFVFPAGNELS